MPPVRCSRCYRRRSPARRCAGQAARRTCPPLRTPRRPGPFVRHEGRPCARSAEPEGTVGNRRGFLVGEGGRSGGQKSVTRPAHILRVRPEAVSVEAEYPVTDLERPDVRSDRINLPGQHHAQHRLSGCMPPQCQPRHDPVGGIQPQPPEVAVARRHRSRPNADAHLVRPGSRSREILEPEHLRRSVPRADDRSHLQSRQPTDPCGWCSFAFPTSFLVPWSTPVADARSRCVGATVAPLISSHRPSTSSNGT